MKMHFQEHLAFFLNGKHSAADLDAAETLTLRPALLGRYRSLVQLRYDYPLVLAKQRSGEAPAVHSLSALCDALVADAPAGLEGDRLRYLAHRIEGEIRKQVASGASATLWSLWEWTERQLLNQESPPQRQDLDRLRAALTADGPVFDCDAQLPWRLLQHCWQQDQERKADLMRDRIERLVFKLCEILQVDEESSEAGVGAQRLQASFSSAFASDFNFDALSNLLSTAKPKAPLPQARRQRVQRLLGVLQSQHFFPIGNADRSSAYAFTFDSCSQALKAYRQRLPEMVELAKAIMVAELEVEGTYHEQTHNAVFDAIGSHDLDLTAVAQFPDYLINIPERSLTASEGAKLIEMLTAGLPVKLLLQTDDIAPSHKANSSYLASGVSARHWANMAIGVGGVFVLQAPASHLYRFRERIARGLSYSGPALFCVYSGAGGASRDVPPYLMAAAALESRAFPAFVYDPGAGPDWASRCYVGDTPQPERDWPVYELSYEDEALQRTCIPTAFTLLDFLALDARYAPQLARVPRAQWDENMVPAADFIELDPQGLPDRVPYLWMVDDQDALHRVLVSHQLIRQARRVREQWHSLRELGGICNSFAEQLLAKERQEWEAEQQAAQQAAAVAPPAAAVPSEPAPTAAPAEGEAPPPAPARSPDEAYIETIRCSTCNECTQINDRMFKYNENKQAYIADLSAGTYAQLVLAAERCQLAIIHPGKPANPNEPGLEELLKRAEPFR